jgi:protein ImuB
LSEVPLEARHRRLLEKLGIRRFGQLAALSPDDLARRFGSELVQALQTFQAFNVLPLQPVHRDPAPGVGCQLEAPVSDRSLLLPVIRDLLTPVLERLLREGRLLAELRLEFALETWASSVTPARLVEVLRPAAPTNDPKGWNKLVDLRLSQGEFPAAVLEVHLTFSEVDPPPGSGELFAAPQSRDLHRGAQALALIRAQWGNDSVVRPLLLESHLPEGSFRWEEIGLLRPPKRKAPAAMLENHALEMPVPVSAIRRVFRPLARRAGPCAGERLAGPYRLSQPTCNGVAVDREYWFLRTKSLEVQWVAYNRLTSTSELTGMVD